MKLKTMPTKKKIEKVEEVENSAIPETNVCSKKKCCGMSHKFWLVIVVIILIIAGYFVWTNYLSQPKTPAEAQKAAEQKVQALVERVRRHMILPEKEIPQVAEIQNAVLAAQEQPFLAGSQNGDVLIVYIDIGKAIVYSPARDLIVNVGPIQIGKTNGSDQPSAKATSTSKTKK